MEHEPQFLIEMAHEFQTPIAIIVGNLEIMEGDDKEERERAAQVIRGTLSGMSRLVKDILGAAGSRSLRQDLKKEIIDIGLLLADIREDCRVLAADKNIALTVSHGSSPCFEKIFIAGDKQKLKEVIFNLIHNALIHTGPEGSISLHSLPGNGDGECPVACIRVEDTGSGIAAADLEHIFERFYRIANNGNPGSGLGLFICRNIIEAHGGTIVAESEVGKGSCFTITLPLSSGSL